jgi:hypothetical protein
MCISVVDKNPNKSGKKMERTATGITTLELYETE